MHTQPKFPPWRMNTYSPRCFPNSRTTWMGLIMSSPFPPNDWHTSTCIHKDSICHCYHNKNDASQTWRNNASVTWQCVRFSVVAESIRSICKFAIYFRFLCLHSFMYVHVYVFTSFFFTLKKLFEQRLSVKIKFECFFDSRKRIPNHR